MADILSMLINDATKCGQSCGITAFNGTAQQLYSLGDCKDAVSILQAQYAKVGHTDIYA